MNGIEKIAQLTSALQAVTELVQTAQALGREVTDEELDLAEAQGIANAARARQMVQAARERGNG